MFYLARLVCALFGHPGVYRQWEWRMTVPTWKETTDHWTCIRCHRDMVTVPLHMPRYGVERPYMDVGLVEYINATIERAEQDGAVDLRILSGDPATRTRHLSPTE